MIDFRIALRANRIIWNITNSTCHHPSWYPKQIQWGFDVRIASLARIVYTYPASTVVPIFGVG